MRGKHFNLIEIKSVLVTGMVHDTELHAIQHQYKQQIVNIYVNEKWSLS